MLQSLFRVVRISKSYISDVGWVLSLADQFKTRNLAKPSELSSEVRLTQAFI